MKKIILKITTVILAFFLGIILMGWHMMAGNNELMDSMADASLPLVSMVLEGQTYNTMHGYVGEMDGRFIRGDVLPLPSDRQLSVFVEPYGMNIEHIYYEVRSQDHSRLIEDTEVTYVQEDGLLKAELPIKDLLDEGEEYALVIRLETGNEVLVSYYTRIANIGETHLNECLEFASVWHDATFDKENQVSISKYLEPDSSADNDTLAEVTIHSRYRQIIWDQMEMQPFSDIDIYISEISPSVACLRFDFVTQFNNEGRTEYYQVQEYFRIRYTEQRMYLLDYYRTADRIFDKDAGVFGESQLELGILNESVHYLKNEEENVVAFVQNGDLWSYDAARNSLSCVMGFRNGWDKRADFQDHDVRIIDIDESGSMHFMVYGYMNRGLHEGHTGIAVYYYDAVANTVEEKVFLESQKPYEVLKELLGDLAYVTGQEVLYFYFDGGIYAIDLDSREWKALAEHVPENCYLLSEDQTILAWQDANSFYEAQQIYLLNLETGRLHTIEAQDGEYIQGLGFMGTDFIWGAARWTDIQKDVVGDVLFPMYKISIQSVTGEIIRDFSYENQGKYIIAISMEDNRISLECMQKTEDGSYEPAAPEPITNKTEDKAERIVLRTRSASDKKKEYILAFTNKREDTEPQELNPKQVLFEGSRNVVIEQEKLLERYYVYGRGTLSDSYGTLRDAVNAADAIMGVVTDRNQEVIWRRGANRTRVQLTGIEAKGLQDGETSVEVCLSAIFNFERIYPDIAYELSQGWNVYEILDRNLEEEILDLSGCDLSTVLYYVSEGKPVLVMMGEQSAVLIVGYDTQNTILYDPAKGEIFKMGMSDSTNYFSEAGNLFIAYLE